MRLLNAEQMRELDRRTIEEIGVPGVVLMENAGRGAAESMARHFAGRFPGPVLVLAGKGNNGGDGYVIARHLANWGWQVRTLVLADRDTIGGDAAINLTALINCGGDVGFVAGTEALQAELDGHCSPALLVDALLGTGLASDVKGLYALAIDWINASPAPAVAVDIPSGVDASTGRILGRAVEAELTITFAFAKLGHVLHPAAQLTGQLDTLDIGIPRSLTDAAGAEHLLVEASEAAALLPRRPVTGHKGTFGHLLVVAGAIGKTGAATLTAEGGLRSGAGLVTAVCPRSVHHILEIKLTEAMTAPLDDVAGALSLQALEQVRNLWDGKQALALGPGLGLAAETAALVRHLVRECPIPLVLDADGINALGAKPDMLKERAGRATILTPHPGEMARLLGISVAEVERDRIACARSFARSHQVVLVLKGARTVTAFADGRIRINASGHQGMASGGMGDVLTGLIGGLLAQGLSAEAAAVLGVYLHGCAADRLRPRLGAAGMTAGDLVQELPAARYYLQSEGVFDA